MAEGGDWEFPGGDYDEDRGDDVTDDRASLLSREGDWSEGRGRPSSRKSSSRRRYGTGKESTSSRFGLKEMIRGLDESILEFTEDRQNEAKRRIQEKYPDWDPAKSRFVATINEKDRVTVSLIKGKKIDAKPYVLFKEDGTLRAGLPQKVIEDLGKTIFVIVDERDVKIDELRKSNEGLSKKIEELNSRLGSEFHENEEKVRKLGKKTKEDEKKISTLEDEKKRLKEERDEALKQVKEGHEEKLRGLKQAIEVSESEREKMEKLKEDNDEQNRKTNEIYKREMNEKSEKITNLEKRLDLNEKEKRDLVAAANEDLEGLENQRVEDLKKAKEDYEEELKVLEQTIEANEEVLKRTIETSKTSGDEKIEEIKANNAEHIRRIKDKYEEEIKEKNEEITNLENKLGVSGREKGELIAAAKEDLTRLNDRKDEELNKTRKDYEARLRELDEKNEAVGGDRDKFYNDKIGDLKSNYAEHIREITNGYEERIREKDEQISNLEKRLDLNEKEKIELITATNEDLKRLNDQKDEALKQAREDYEAKVEKLKRDNVALGKERDKFYDDKISDLKANYGEHIREITNGYEERIREKDKRITNLSKELRRTQMSMEDLSEEMTEIKNKTLSVEEQRILEESEMTIEENEERIDELTRENEATLENYL